MGPFCYLGNHAAITKGGETGHEGWHPESPFYGLASFIETFSGTLIPYEDFEGLLGDSERTG